jgi:hypothetical protein
VALPCPIGDRQCGLCDQATGEGQEAEGAAMSPEPPHDPHDTAIPHWFSLPLALRQRWWRETDYGRLKPSRELAEAIAAAAPR